jgi:hypothetical protein
VAPKHKGRSSSNATGPFSRILYGDDALKSREWAAETYKLLLAEALAELERVVERVRGRPAVDAIRESWPGRGLLGLGGKLAALQSELRPRKRGRKRLPRKAIGRPRLSSPEEDIFIVECYEAGAEQLRKKGKRVTCKAAIREFIETFEKPLPEADRMKDEEIELEAKKYAKRMSYMPNSIRKPPRISE